MDYEKKYKDALERANSLLSGNELGNAWIYKLFPELKESEDERIRGAIVDYLKDNALIEWAAWLEKQCKQKSNEEYNITGISSKHAEGKLGEMIKNLKPVNKVLEQEHINKVEPKFKVGDWVVNKLGDSWHIDSFYKKNYQVSDGKGNYNYFPIFKQDEMHLWTINDVKDGNVLQLGEVTAIFKEFIGNENCRCYCSICEGEFEIPSQNGDDNYGCYNATPATKEQRDTLEKAMADVGYTFDFESKELKKIGKESVKWSEEDETKLKSACALIRNTSLNGNEGVVDTTITWLKSLKNRVQPQPKQEWSEEDRGNLLDVKCIIDEAWHNQDFREEIGRSSKELESLWHWLDNIWRKVKYPQNFWNPSDEELDALHDAAVYVDKSMFPHPKGVLMKLYKQLKKLRKE